MKNKYELFKKEFDESTSQSMRDINNNQEIENKNKNRFNSAISENNLYEAFFIAKNYFGEDKASFILKVIDLCTEQGDIVLAIESAKMIGINLDIHRLDKILKLNLEKRRMPLVKQTLQYIQPKFRLAVVNLYAKKLYENKNEEIANNLLSMYLDLNYSKPDVPQNNSNGGVNKKKKSNTNQGR